MRHNQDRWRGYLKVALASAITRASRLQDYASRARIQRRPLIIGYHRVVEDFAASSRTDMPSMLISRTMFERHVEWIGRHFTFVSLDEIGAALAEGRPFRKPVAAITFDDGYEDVYENAFPLLRRKGIPAAMFVVTDLIGRPVWQVHDKLYHLVDKAFAMWNDPQRQLLQYLDELEIQPGAAFRGRHDVPDSMNATSNLLPALSQSDVSRLMEHLERRVGNGATHIPSSVTWPMIHEMRAAGITIGSHTKSHVSLPMETSAVVEEQLAGSKRILEQGLGERIDHFAYPAGQFTPAIVEALSRTGYRYAYTACPHRESRLPLLTIERLLLWEGSSIDADGEFSSAVLNCQVHDLWPPARRCERLHHA